jgi:hypothetical protein
MGRLPLYLLRCQPCHTLTLTQRVPTPIQSLPIATPGMATTTAIPETRSAPCYPLATLETYETRWMTMATVISAPCSTMRLALMANQ